MQEYKVVAVSLLWGGERKATHTLNELAQEGWQFRDIRFGFNVWLTPKLFMVVEKARSPA